METSDYHPKATEQDEDLFEENEFVSYDLANNHQRFLNYLIDSLLMRYAIGYAIGFLLGKLVFGISPQLAFSLFVVHNLLAAYIIALINHLVYYTVCESAFNGRTLGKLITGTKAIREDGNRITFKDAFMRSLCRLVPFEQFSIWFGTGLWHDAWTHTHVIQVRRD